MASHSGDDIQTVGAVRFATALEARLGVTVVSKVCLSAKLFTVTLLKIRIVVQEQITLIPDSQRILFCDLFREIRLLTRSLKP